MGSEPFDLIHGANALAQQALQSARATNGPPGSVLGDMRAAHLRFAGKLRRAAHDLEVDLIELQQ